MSPETRFKVPLTATLGSVQLGIKPDQDSAKAIINKGEQSCLVLATGRDPNRSERQITHAEYPPMDSPVRASRGSAH